MLDKPFSFYKEPSVSQRLFRRFSFASIMSPKEDFFKEELCLSVFSFFLALYTVAGKEFAEYSFLFLCENIFGYILLFFGCYFWMQPKTKPKKTEIKTLFIFSFVLHGLYALFSYFIEYQESFSFYFSLYLFMFYSVGVFSIRCLACWKVVFDARTIVAFVPKEKMLFLQKLLGRKYNVVHATTLDEMPEQVEGVIVEDENLENIQAVCAQKNIFMMKILNM